MSVLKNFDYLIARAAQIGNGFVFASVVLRTTAPPVIIVHELCKTYRRGLR